jgi:hypothetical protein
MSIHAHFDKADRIERLDEAPIVLRFKPMFPLDLQRREMHAKRLGGDLTHIREHLSHLNWQEIGGPDWIDRLTRRIADAARANLQEEIEARTRKGRHKEAREVRMRGLVDPWKYTRLGPLREGVLTVNKKWLGGTGLEEWDLRRVYDFLDRAMEFLIENFPEDQLLEVHADMDEEAFHLHFVVGVWVEKVSGNRGRQLLLQPSANPLVARYEHAQDLAGEAFVDLGIHRGERRAEAVRQALAAGLEVPESRRHVPPSRWRREQRRLALEDRDRIRAETRAEATATVADGVALAKSVIKKSRKRSIKEAKARRAETDRQAAAVERDRTRAEAQAEVARCAKLEAEAARKEADLQAEAARERSVRIIASANDRAGVILSDAKLVGTKALKKTRKRAARETQTLRDEVRRMKADTAMELRRGQLAAAFVRGWTARLQERARSLSHDIEAKAKIWTDRERQHRAAELRLARIEQERMAAEAEIAQARSDAAGMLATAEARVEEARQSLEKTDADRIEAERIAMAVREKASRITHAAENRAGEIVADATALATVTVRKSRKRAIAEARARRAEAERAAAAAEREREEAETRAEQARQAQARAQAEREAAEEAAVAARAEAVRVQHAAEAEADWIRTDAAAAAQAEQARADAARQAREEADTARQAAEQAAARAIHNAESERSEAARALARADVVASGLVALTEELAAGTLRLRDNGRVAARAPDLLLPAYPEIAPAVRAAATVAEQTRAARRAADAVIRAAEAEIARDKAAAAGAIAQERQVAQGDLKKQREAVTSELAEKRAELDRQESEVQKQWAFLATLLDRFEPLLKKVMRWLSHPDLPAEMKEEGIDIAAEAVSVLGALRQDDPYL